MTEQKLTQRKGSLFGISDKVILSKLLQSISMHVTLVVLRGCVIYLLPFCSPV